jgi:hypothetical protein
MDLIANIAAWVLAFFASVLGNIWAHDICASADRTCTKIVRGAARRLAPFDQESGEQEWLADLNDRLTVREKYQHAIGCYLVAGKMRRAAIKVTLVLCFHIDAVGDVPLDFNVGSKLFLTSFSIAARAKPVWIRHFVIVCGLLYFFRKLLRSARHLGPARFKTFASVLGEYRTWNYDIQIKRKGLELNLTNIARAIIQNPDRITEIGNKLVAFLKENLPPAKPFQQSTPPA